VVATETTLGAIAHLSSRLAEAAIAVELGIEEALAIVAASATVVVSVIVVASVTAVVSVEAIAEMRAGNTTRNTVAELRIETGLRRTGSEVLRVAILLLTGKPGRGSRLAAKEAI